MDPALAIVTTISMVTGDRSLGALYFLFLIGSPLLKQVLKFTNMRENFYFIAATTAEK